MLLITDNNVQSIEPHLITDEIVADEQETSNLMEDTTTVHLDHQSEISGKHV